MDFARKDDTSHWPLEDAEGNYYGEKLDGYISFGDVARNLMGKQCQYGSRYILGEPDSYPSLGQGLRFNGLDDPGGNYHTIGIHPQDIEEFIRRYYAYMAFMNGSVEDTSGNYVQLDQQDFEVLGKYLEDIGAFEAGSWRQ